MRKEKGGGGALAAGHAPRRSSPPSSLPLAGDEGDPGTASPDSTATQGIKPPRLSAFVPCMSLMAFVPFVDVWAFVPYVDVWAFVPYKCYRPSCRIYAVGHRVGFFLAGFGNLPVQGRFCQNF